MCRFILSPRNKGPTLHGKMKRAPEDWHPHREYNDKLFLIKDLNPCSISIYHECPFATALCLRSIVFINVTVSNLQLEFTVSSRAWRAQFKTQNWDVYYPFKDLFSCSLLAFCGSFIECSSMDPPRSVWIRNPKRLFQHLGVCFSS